MIYNNNYWKGFFPNDPNIATLAMKYMRGFWKRFFRKEGEVRGITHPYDAPVFADNIAQIMFHPRYGEVVHLKYTGPEHSSFYYLIKIVDTDTILGKAFFGTPPGGTQMVFSMCRRYSADFMAEEDHEKISVDHGRAPAVDEAIGRWTGRLVSDSALSPQAFTFSYTKDNFGKLQMQYIFAGILSGMSRVEMNVERMLMFDYTNWTDEVKIVTQDFMIGK